MVGRTFWLLDLLVVGICAGLLGHAGAGLMRPPPGRSAQVARSTAPDPAAPPRPPPEAIARRNVFCSSCPFRDGSKVAEVAPGWRPTQLPLVLVAINLIVGGRPAMATIRHTETGRVGAFQPGGRVLGARITSIWPDRVDLDNQGVPELLSLLSQAASSAPAPIRQETGVRQTAGTDYEIDRAVLEQALGNLNQLAQSVRLLPEVKAGVPAGFRVVDLRPGSLLERLGLRRGDVLASINGLELTSVEKAMELYVKLKSVGHLALVVDRGGKLTTLRYVVR